VSFLKSCDFEYLLFKELVLSLFWPLYYFFIKINFAMYVNVIIFSGAFQAPWCVNKTVKIQDIFKVKVENLEITATVDFETCIQCYWGKFLRTERSKCHFWLEEEGAGELQPSQSYLDPWESDGANNNGNCPNT